jgi:hypothetical protein
VSEVRISAATRVVSTLSYRDSPDFKEAGLAAVVQRIPQVIGHESIAQNIAKTIAVFGAFGAGESSIPLQVRLVETMTTTLIADRVTPTCEKMKIGLELLASPRFAEDYPWERQIGTFVASTCSIFRGQRNPEVIRLWAPSLIIDRRMITTLGSKSAELADDLLAERMRRWHPTTVEAVYDILWIECGLVRDSVLTARSEAALSLCSALEAALQRWKDESSRSPEAAALLAHELAPLCTHILTIFAVFPEIQSWRFNALVEENSVFLSGLAHKGIEIGAELSDVTRLLSGKHAFKRELVEGFNRFLCNTPPNQVLLGLDEWWTFLQIGWQGPKYNTNMKPFVRVLNHFLANCSGSLKIAAEQAIEIVHAHRSSPDRVKKDELTGCLQTYGALYSLFCEGRAHLLGKDRSEVEFDRSTMAGEGVDPATGELDPKDDSEQGGLEDDSLLSFALDLRSKLSYLARVNNALQAALSNLRCMSAWAATQICYSEHEVFLPPEERYGRILVDILNYDLSKDPVEAQWAYNMQILRLLACPEVQRLARYGGANRYVVVSAMREVLARQRGFDDVSDGVIRFES